MESRKLESSRRVAAVSSLDKKSSGSINKFVYMCDDDDMRSETKINI